MVILHQNRTSIFNFDNIESLYVDDNLIMVEFLNGNSRAVCAKYASAERAEEIFSQIIETMLKRKVDVVPFPAE